MDSSDERAAAALEKLAAIGGENFDRSQMDELKAKLAKIGRSDEKTASGSEAPQNQAAAQPARALTGRDIDWSEYDLDFNVAHLYPQAVYRDTPQGPQWVALIPDFYSTLKQFGSQGQTCNAPGSSDGTMKEPKNLAEYLSNMVNGREQWKISAVMPVGQQCGVLLERQVPIFLGNPPRLKKSEEVEAPTDPALQAVEDAALKFVEEQGTEKDLTETPEDENILGETPLTDIGLRAVESGTAEYEQARAQTDEVTGAIEARSSEAIAKALQTAAPMTTAAPTAGVIQPEAVENPIINAPVPAAGYQAAQDLLRALNDPNFRAQLPKEE